MTTSTPQQFIPRTAGDALAVEIARTFHDDARLALYRRICAGHDHSLVYRAFKETMEVPQEQVKRSRRALFLFFLHSYDEDYRPRN